MKENKHLTYDQRLAIQDGISQNATAARIGRAIGVSPSTIIREVKRNRETYTAHSSDKQKLRRRCAHYATCTHSAVACKKCVNSLSICRRCQRHLCIETCPDFTQKKCHTVEKWPYVCPSYCHNKVSCIYERAHYKADRAQVIADERLVLSREGISIDQKALKALCDLMKPLMKKGQSPEAIFLTHKDEIPISIATFYRYHRNGYLPLTSLDFPRIARYKKRAKKKDTITQKKAHIRRAGHTFEDFKALPFKDRQRCLQLDSVVGFKRNTKDILSMHVKATKFQFYFLKQNASSKEVPRILDMLEETLGGCEEFQKLFGILLADRGKEFDNVEAIETSCTNPKKKRCKLFYCDPLRSNQKAEAERNHEQLRRILPKKRTDFDTLSSWSVATACSHVNSYPLASLDGLCPFEASQGLFDEEFLATLGLKRIPADEVILKPSCIKKPHSK